MDKKDIEEIMRIRMEIKKKLEEIDELVGKINAIIYLRGKEEKLRERDKKICFPPYGKEIKY